MSTHDSKQRAEREWRGGYAATGNFSDLKPPPRGPAPGAKPAPKANGSEPSTGADKKK